MRLRPPVPFGLILLAVFATCVRGQVTAEQIDTSVARGVASLLKTQRAGGGWGDYDSGIPDFSGFGGMGRRGGPGRPGPGDRPDRTIIFEHGKDVAGLLGLAYSGMDTADARLQKALDRVLKAEVSKNYVLGLRVLALARLHDRLPARYQRLARAVMAQDVAALAENQNSRGLWSTERARRDSDMSDTAMAIAALGESAGIMRPKEGNLWKQSLSALMEHQREDGQWDYLQMTFGRFGGFDFGSTTVNGVAGLLALRTVVFRGGGCPCRDGKSAAAGEEVTRSIDRGLDRMSGDADPGRMNRRGLLATEWAFFSARCGVLSGYRSFGSGAWYPQLAATVIGRQGEDGGWGDTVRTGLSLAALNTGREPIFINKLRLPGQPWHRHPDDAAGLVGYVSSQKKELLRWQIVDLDAKIENLHEAPLAYLSVESAPTLTDAQRKTLRKFTDTGGTILVEASCGDKDAAEWCEKLCADLWPEWPPEVLPREHALWSADQRLGARHPVLKGVDDGLRTCVLVSQRDLSCLWALGDTRTNRDAFRLGLNLLAYTTDRGVLRSKWQSAKVAEDRYAGQQLKRGKRDRITIARIQHGGDWNVGRNYRPWDRLVATTLGKAGVTVTETDPIEPGRSVPETVTLLYLTGRRACDIDESGAAWLTKSVDGGPFLLVEAALGDKRFNNAVRKVLASAGLELRLLGADAPPLTGRLFEATGFKLNQVSYSTSLEAERAGKAMASLPDGGAWPEGVAVVLYGIYSGNKLVGVYSPFDVVFSQTGYRAFGTLGYSAADARAVAANLLLLASIR